MKLILASGSPRRKDLLTAAGVNFTVEVSEAEEVYTSSKPSEIVAELAAIKAGAVAKLHEGLFSREGDAASGDPLLILGADTVVAVDNEILGKPHSVEEAYEMIRKLSGRTHFVYTGVCLIRLQKENTEAGSGEGVYRETGRKNFSVGSEVFVRPLTEEMVRSYVAEGEFMDKAGAYAIQGGFGKYIDRIEGDYENIIGLPVKAVLEAIRELENS